MGGSLVAFTLVAAVVTITPGLDTALVVRSTLRDGRGAGFDAALGICSGLVVWGFATALGITVLLRASQTAYDVLRIGGAVWLVILGVRTLLDARRSVHPSGDEEGTASAPSADTPDQRRRRLASYRNGVTSNLLNPKVGVFYLTLLPQFVPDAAPVLPTTLLFVAIHITQGLLWLAFIAWLTSRARGVLGRGVWRRASERLTGVVLLGLGLRLAIERR
jgi:threonine/homoserine/homoserine lactone efflux protein